MVHRKRVPFPMRLMENEAISLTPGTSQPCSGAGHKVYPHPLGRAEINLPTQRVGY